MQVRDLLDYAVRRRGLVAAQEMPPRAQRLTTIRDSVTGRLLMCFEACPDPGGELPGQRVKSPSGLICDVCCVEGFRQTGGKAAVVFSSPFFAHHESGWRGLVIAAGAPDAEVFAVLDRALGFDEGCGCEMVLDKGPACDGAPSESVIPEPEPRVLNSRPVPAAERPRRPGGDAVSVEGVVYADVLLSTCPDAAGDAGKAGENRAALERIQAMRSLYEPPSSEYRYLNWETEQKMKLDNFLRQGRFMEDFEDDIPWQAPFHCYYPTYQEMSVRQLRTYFSWRTKLRRGIYRPVATSMLYVYLYELINGIGVASPEDALKKMDEVSEHIVRPGFLSSPWDVDWTRRLLADWRLSLGIVNRLPAGIVRDCVDSRTIAYEHDCGILEHCAEVDDETLFAALDSLCGGRLSKSAAVKRTDARDRSGRRLFASVWRAACGKRLPDGRTVFSAAFGRRTLRRWTPFERALYPDKGGAGAQDFTYELTPERQYLYRAAQWYVRAYPVRAHDLSLFRGLMHEADRRLRLFLGLPRPLREREDEKWAAPCVEAAIEAERQRRIEARRRSVQIDPGSLEAIRRNAALTRERLLTDEEREEAAVDVLPVGRRADRLQTPGTDSCGASADGLQAGQETPSDQGCGAVAAAGANAATPGAAPAGLDDVHRYVLAMLLAREAPEDYMRANHLMPEVVADTINEVFLDAVGDSVVVCDNDRLSLVEDYRGDVEAMLGH